LNGVELSGVAFVPHGPTDGKYDGVEVRGIRLHVTDRRRYDPTRAAALVLAAIRAAQPDSLRFDAARFDRLAQGATCDAAILADRHGGRHLAGVGRNPLARFPTRARQVLCSIETFAPSGYLPPAMNLNPQSVRDGFGKTDRSPRRPLHPSARSPNLITTVVPRDHRVGDGVRPGVGFALEVSCCSCPGIFDMVDGRVARRADMSTTFGAFYDSTLDRVGESVLFSGIAVYFLRGGVPPSAWRSRWWRASSPWRRP